MEALLRELVAKVDALGSKMEHFEAKLDAVSEKFNTLMLKEATANQKKAVRRAIYREKHAEMITGRISLPKFNCMEQSDVRIDLTPLIEMGKQYGKMNKPYQFLTSVVHHWNTKLYLKKPVTFSGSAFRIWNGACRIPRGPGDLMHYYRKRINSRGQLLRNKNEEYDFHRRPWFSWADRFLWPIVSQLKESPEWEQYDSHFKTCVQLLCSGKAEMQFDDLTWDLQLPMQEFNKVFPKVSHIWHKVLEACLVGLKMKK